MNDRVTTDLLIWSYLLVLELSSTSKLLIFASNTALQSLDRTGLLRRSLGYLIHPLNGSDSRVSSPGVRDRQPSPNRIFSSRTS